MSLELYEKLVESSKDDLGVQLPKLISSRLSIVSTQGDLAKVHEKINELSPKYGWVMYRDLVEIKVQLQDRDDLLEAEFSDGNVSIKIRHTHGNNYQITEFNPAKIPAKNTTVYHQACYKEQEIFVRNRLQDKATTAIYRLWFSQEAQGDNQGRWQPLAQQFMGFAYDN